MSSVKLGDSQSGQKLTRFLLLSVAARGAPGPRERAHQAEGTLRGGDAALQRGAGASAGGDGGETPGHDGGG